MNTMETLLGNWNYIVMSAVITVSAVVLTWQVARGGWTLTKS